MRSEKFRDLRPPARIIVDICLSVYLMVDKMDIEGMDKARICE